MNKEDFINFIAKDNNITKKEALKIIDTFCVSVTKALSEKDSVSIVGFGKFNTNNIPPRDGKNPRTGAPIKIKGYIQPKFSAGKRLKDACNN